MADKIQGNDLLRIFASRAAALAFGLEMGQEVDDVRGGTGTITITENYSTNGLVTVTRQFSAGNRYKFVQANATVTVGDALIYDVSFATAAERNFVVIQSTNSAAGGVVAGAIDQQVQGAGVAVNTTFATSGQCFWMTVRGRVSAKVGTVAAGDQLTAKTTAGTFNTTTISASPAQAEVQNVLANSCGLGARAMAATNTPATGAAWIHLQG